MSLAYQSSRDNHVFSRRLQVHDDAWDDLPMRGFYPIQTRIVSIQPSIDEHRPNGPDAGYQV